MGKTELNRLVVEGKIFSTFVRPLRLEIRKEICSKCFSLRFLSLYKNKPKVIKDPVYGAIALDPEDVFLLDTCFMQRLRYIRQTSFLNYLVPTATHTRFDHSLGAYFWAKNIFRVLENNRELEDLAREIYQKLIEHIKKLKQKIEKKDPTICDMYYDYVWIIKHIDEKALNDGKIILRLNNDLVVTIDSEEFCSLWVKAEYLVVKYAALLHDLAHYPFSHLGEKLNEIICKSISERIIDSIYKKLREGDLSKSTADKIIMILRFWSRCKLCYKYENKGYCDPHNYCKPHELDAIRLIIQEDIKDEKSGVVGKNCIRYSLYHLLEKS